MGAGLFHSLNVGAESLFNTRQGVDTTSHNIANAQTEGYSRQRVNITSRDPSVSHGQLIGNGSYVTEITRSHDAYAEKQLVLANGKKGGSAARHDALANLESVYDPELASNVSTEMSAFFDALNSLSNFPEDLSARTAVYEQAENLTAAFRRIDSDLNRNLSGINDQIQQGTAEVSGILKSIADLNVRIREMETGPKNEANDMRDQRDGLVRQLAEKIDINYYEDKWGMVTIRGPGDSLLVEGQHSASFDVRVNTENSNMYDVLVMDFEGDVGRNVTNRLGDGALGGLVDVRDNVAQKLVLNNNQMAKEFSDAFNSIHRKGYGLKDFTQSTGRNFFEPVTNLNSAARDLKVSSIIVNSVDAISASSTPNSAGDNIVLNDLLRLKDEKILGEGTASLNDFYASYVGELGLEAVRSKHDMDANDLLASSLQSARDAVSGVSLDEEATNMIKWQTAFTASSKVITTVDEMLETVLSLKR